MSRAALLGGRYSLEVALAAGPTGTIFRARDEETGEIVAVSRFELAETEELMRLERELPTVRALRHDAIARCRDTGKTATGQPYLVMDRLDGESLLDRLRRSELDLDESLVVAVRLLSALGEAHAVGILHRDVQPANIFLPSKLASAAKLLGFGAPGRGLGGAGGARAQAIGTAGYVAPELVRGEPADPRTDIYSAGAVLFRCLAGRAVFEEDGPVEALVRAARDSAPLLGELRSDLTPALTQLVDRMLSRERVDRPAGAADVLEELRMIRPSLGGGSAPAPSVRPRATAGCTSGSSSAGYRIGRLLGKGAMGRVHEAIRQPDGGRFAAKMLLGDAADASERRALVNEALAMSELHHPNIIEVVDLLDDPELGVVLVTELVEGRSLAEAVEELGLVERLGIIAQVLTGLGAAHAQGVVHGDLKPSNILVSQSSIAKICDFGVAQVLGAMKDGGLRRINAGTPAFMPPEQFTDGTTLHPRTDLYAIGVLLYEAVAGRQPWRGANLARVYSEKVAGFEPPKVDAQGRPVPRRLSSLIGSLCEPKPEARLRFAREALEILEEARGEIEPQRTPEIGPAARASPLVAHTELLRTGARGESSPSPAAAPAKAGEETMRFLASGARLFRPPLLFGREVELRVIRETMAEVLASRKPQMIFMTGEPGIGRSRLGDWALAEAERSATFEGAAARFSVGGTAPLRGLRGVVQRLLDASGGTRVRAAFDHLRQVGALTVGCDEPAVVHWLSTPADTFLLDANTAAALALETIRSIAQCRPVLLWLDDLAHSTDGSVDLARALLASSDLPVLVIAASNDADIERSPARDRLLALSRMSTRLRLGRLTPEASHALFRSIVEADRDACQPPTLDGVPRDIVALARDYRARGSIIDDPVTGPQPRLELRDLSDRWLRPLKQSMGDRFELLLGASLVAGHLTTKLLRAMARELGSSEVSADLAVDEALLGGVFVPDGGEHFKISGEALRAHLQSLCEAHSKATTIHRAASAALIGTFGQERPDVVAHAARLTHEGGDPATAAGLVLEAADVMAFGGDLASGRAYHSLGGSWLEELGLEDHHPLAQLHAYVDARIRYFALDYDGTLDLAQPLLAAIEARMPDSPMRLKVARLVLRALFYSDRFDECEAELRRVAPALEVDPWGHAHAVHLRSHLMAVRGDLSGCAQALERELDRAREACPEICIVFSSELAELAASRGDAETAKRRLMEAELLVRDVYEAVNVRQVRSTVSTLLGEPIDRRVWLELCDGCRRRNEKWRLTAALAQLALHDLGSAHAQLHESVTAAIDAFDEVPHDEPPTHAALARLGAAPDMPEPVRARIARALARRRAVALAGC